MVNFRGHLSKSRRRLTGVKPRVFLTCLALGLVGLLAVSSLSPQVFAGSGSGGGAGSCATTAWNYPCVQWGEGWATYNILGSGPGLGFINGTTSWNNIQNDTGVNGCRGFSQVAVFVIDGSTGESEGYTYGPDLDTNNFKSTPGPAFGPDGGATPISTKAASIAYSKVPKQNKNTNLKWGDDTNPPDGSGGVGWFCYNPTPATIDAHTSVSDTTASPGEQIKFTNSVKNEDSSSGDANFDWEVMGNHNGRGYGSNNNGYNAYSGSDACGIVGPDDNGGSTGLPNSSTSNLSPGNSNPDGNPKGSCVYVFPGNAKNGDTYCIQMWVNPSSGTTVDTSGNMSSQSGGWYSDQGACTTLNAPNSGPPGGLVGTCTSAYFNVGASYTPSGGSADSTLRYALYETPGGTSPDNSNNQGFPWSAGQTLTSASQNSDNQAYPDVTWGALDYESGIKPDTYHKYSLSSSQVSSGTVNWYLVTFNLGSTSTPIKHTKWVGKGKDRHRETYYTQGAPYTYYVYIDHYYTATPTNCFEASCSLAISPSSEWNDTDFVGGDTVTVTYTVKNTGSNTLNDPGPTPGDTRPLSATSQLDGGASQENGVGESLDSGETSDPETFTVRAPTDTNVHTITVYPGYWNLALISSPGCSATFDSFEPFNITGSAPTATLEDVANQPSQEDPTHVAKAFSWSNSDAWPAPSTVTMNLYTNTYGATQFSVTPVESDPTSGSYGNGNLSANYALPAGWGPGDQYCPEATIDPSTGYVGPSGAELNTANATVKGNCDTIHNEPYAQFFGNDVSAGGAFANGYDQCSSGENSQAGGQILAWLEDSNRGSGSQFAAIANGNSGKISEFGTAMIRGSPPTPIDGLEFPNNPDGSSLGTAQCLTDYYGAMPASAGSNPIYNGGLNSSMNGVYYSNGALTISGGDIGVGDNVAIYVNGNVTIAGNITYDGTGGGSGGWSLSSGTVNATNAPSLYIIACGGINISGSVTSLSGVYVAQASDKNCNPAGGGTINTCYEQQYTVCDNQLVVYGGFVANQVNLYRSFASLRDSASGEYPGNINNPANGQNCDLGDGGDPSSSGSNPGRNYDCAGEVFIFSPANYLSQPAIPPIGGSSSGQFDAIESLPPVL